MLRYLADMTSTTSGRIGCGLFLLFALLAAFGPWIAPHDPMEIHFSNPATKQVRQLLPPSADFPLGTTYYGRDNLSQLIVGSRIPFIVGVIAALVITFVGTTIGIVSGYMGGRLGDFLMRVTDIAFGIPFLPLAVVLVALIQPSIWNIIFAISLLMWRTTARVIRSQVLTIKQYAYIKASRVAGAGSLRIMCTHIFPNVLPMSLLYVSFGIAWAVVAEASLSFLGLGDPNSVSWGQMLYGAYLTGSIREAWWTTVPPGLCISLFVLSAFLIGRNIERISNPRSARHG